MRVGFALDGSGTGNSSLSYLTRLPLDQLKIDRSFVLNSPESRGDAVVAQTVNAMALGPGLEVIAEGVETLARRSFLERRVAIRTRGSSMAGRWLLTSLSNSTRNATAIATQK